MNFWILNLYDKMPHNEAKLVKSLCYAYIFLQDRDSSVLGKDEVGTLTPHFYILIYHFWYFIKFYRDCMDRLYDKIILTWMDLLRWGCFLQAEMQQQDAARKSSNQINQQIKDKPSEHHMQINNRRLKAATCGGVLPVRLSCKINT